METLGNNLGWQGWMGVESIDREYLLARCSHAATVKTVYCTVHIRPGINELCMFHWLQCSATTCSYNREQNPWLQCTFYLEAYLAVHLICLIEKSPKLGNARIPLLGYVQLRNYHYSVLLHWFKVHNIAEKKVIGFVFVLSSVSGG